MRFRGKNPGRRYRGWVFPRSSPLSGTCWSRPRNCLRRRIFSTWAPQDPFHSSPDRTGPKARGYAFRIRFPVARDAPAGYNNHADLGNEPANRSAPMSAGDRRTSPQGGERKKRAANRRHALPALSKRATDPGPHFLARFRATGQRFLPAEKTVGQAARMPCRIALRIFAGGGRGVGDFDKPVPTAFRGALTLIGSRGTGPAFPKYLLFLSVIFLLLFLSSSSRSGSDAAAKVRE